MVVVLFSLLYGRSTTFAMMNVIDLCFILTPPLNSKYFMFLNVDSKNKPHISNYKGIINSDVSERIYKFRKLVRTFISKAGVIWFIAFEFNFLFLIYFLNYINCNVQFFVFWIAICPLLFAFGVYCKFLPCF